MLKIKRITHTGMWSSAWVYVLAVSGAAIGLNNIWQFPFLTGKYGGSAFLVVYLLCVILIGIPLLISEAVLGRSGRCSPVNAMRRLSERSKADPNWVLLGGIVVIAGFLIFSYLSVIASWTIAYTFRTAVGVFDGQTQDGVGSLFTAFVKDPEKQLFWHALFVAMTMIVVAKGVKAGLEPVIKIAMPLMFVLLLVLFGYVISLDDFGLAVEHLLYPDFTKLTGTGILMALGHAFFSLGLGVGAVMMYSAFLPDSVSIPKVAIMVAIIDTIVAVLAGIIVFSILFAGNIDSAPGPGLLFQSMPVAFDNIGQGRAMATLFYGLLVIVAWMTAIALVEPAMTWLEEISNMGRAKAALYCGVTAWALGIVTILSFNFWTFSFKYFGIEKKLGFFDVIQILTSNYLLPIGGILIALFSGWVLNNDLARRQLNARSPCAFDAWIWSARVVVPILLLIIVFNIRKLFQ